MKMLSRRSAPLLALVLLAVAFVALVSLSTVGLRGARVDLTEQGLYTLSDGTVNILRTLEEPVTLKLYYSEHATGELQQFRTYATRVRELLEEIAARSDGMVTLEVTRIVVRMAAYRVDRCGVSSGGHWGAALRMVK